MIKVLSEIQKKLNGNDIIIDVVPMSYDYHPCSTVICFILLKIVGETGCEIIPINCYDLGYNVTKDQVEEFFRLVPTKVHCFSKKKILHLIKIDNLIDLSLKSFIKTGEVIDESDYNTSAHVFFKNKYRLHKEVNKIIPVTNHVSRFLDVCKDIEPLISKRNDKSFSDINNIVIETLQKIESNGLAIDRTEFDKHFLEKGHLVYKDLIYTEYNILTSTGRPSNRFGGINYAALNKENECRKSFVSRFQDAGTLVMFDYSAYHPHIIAKLVNYNFPDNVNVYEYLGRYYFNTDKLTDDELKKSKNITFQQLYGSIFDECAEIPFFKSIKEYIHHRWEYFNQYGYVETPIYKRQISNIHLKDANPTKLFNYILQASETEYSMKSLVEIIKYLKTKKTKAVLYTYDSVLFDVHIGEGKELILNIKKLMEADGFPTKCYFGKNYHDMKVINL